MSQHSIFLVPRDYDHVPAPEQSEHCLRVLRDVIGESGTATLIQRPSIEFFDCGENFSEIICPHCGAEIDERAWGDLMDCDYVPARSADPVNGVLPGFRIEAYPLPCCGTSATLAELKYVWPVAFGRFAVEIDSPVIGKLTADQIALIETALGCPLTVVYQHL